MMTVKLLSTLALLFAALIGTPFSVSAQALFPHQQIARDAYQELVEINTVTATGDRARAAEAMAARLRAAGFSGQDVQVFIPAPRKGNLVARLRGNGSRRPILLLAHLDVVEAKREDWSVDPFKLLEKDGYFYGRGSGDDKAMAAIFVTNLIRYRQEGYQPDRDIVVVLETDEEIGDENALGIRWLLKNHRDLIDAEFAINEGGGGAIKGGKYLFNAVQASEKVYRTYRLEVRNKGGHSSVPVKDNAITHLAGGLTRLGQFDFPFQLDEVNRTWFERTAKTLAGQVSEDMVAVTKPNPDPGAIGRLSAVNPIYNALMRTTCVATMLDAGHAENALPQTARATVNCRILPGLPEEEVGRTLVRVLADDQITITPVGIDYLASPPSPLHSDFVQAVEKLTEQMWPGLSVIPSMSTGATDSRFLRNAGIKAYGTSGLFGDIDDIRAHGKDERILVKSFYEGQEYLYRLVKALSSEK